MRLKAILILVILFASPSAFAYTSDYKPVFLPKQSKKSITNLKENLKKEFSQLQSIITKKKKVTSFIKTAKPSQKSSVTTPKKSLPL